jgi:hypothetical protein
MARKTWMDKFEMPCKREVKTAPKDFADIKAGQSMLLTVPKDVAAQISKLEPGEEIDIRTLRAKLAKAARADMACPVVTGIHLRTIAEMTGEQLEAGVPVKRLIPVWRAMPEGAPIWKKIENGRSQFEALRRKEGLSGARKSG